MDLPFVQVCTQKAKMNDLSMYLGQDNFKFGHETIRVLCLCLHDLILFHNREKELFGASKMVGL